MVGRSLGIGLIVTGFVVWAIGLVLINAEIESVWSYVRGMPGAGISESLVGVVIGLWVLMPIAGILIAAGATVLYRVGKK